MLDAFILPGISLGISAGTIPGPLQAYIISTTLAYGWRKGLLVVSSPLIADIPIVILIVFLLGQLPESVINLIRIAGGLFLLWIAWGAWKQYQAGVTLSGKADETIIPPKSNLKTLATGIGMIFLSPGPYLFWSTVNGPLLVDALAISPLYAIAFLLAFYGVFLGFLALIVFVFDRVGQVDTGITRRIMLFSIVLLVWFGTVLIADGLGGAYWQRILTIIVGALLLIWFGWHRLRGRFLI